MAERRLFALDQNFPLPIVNALTEYISEAELVAVKDIDPRMSELDDWQLLLALHHDERPWDGLITTDMGMTRLPRELAVLLQTKLSLADSPWQWPRPDPGDRPRARASSVSLRTHEFRDRAALGSAGD